MLEDFKLFGKEWMKRMCNLEFFCQLVLKLCSMHSILSAAEVAGSVQVAITKRWFSLAII